MEKILVVINAHQPDIESIEFACHMASLAKSKLTGLFIENLYFDRTPAGIDGPSYFKTVREISKGVITTDTDQTIKIFKEECNRNVIASEVYTDKGEPMQEAIYESRFADLLIVDPSISFYDRQEQLPSHFVKEILANAECPVLLSPQEFDHIEEVVFCYDGSASSVFAIKQFTYLLPQFSNKKVMLLEVNTSGKEEFNDSHWRVMNWLRAHYSSVYYHGLEGHASDTLFDYFFMKKNKMIVMGAYGRSLLSNFFRRSNADILVRMVDLPLFITHH